MSEPTTLIESNPTIWRRIQVKNCSLDKLHERRRCKSIGFIVRFLGKIIPDGGALTHFT